jgi:DNA-binding IclR family transcriptional regulator
MKRKEDLPSQNRTAARPAADAEDLDAVDPAASGEDVRRLRPLTVLEILTRSSTPLTLAQLAVQMAVPKSTLMRLLQSMESHGYVLHMPAGRGFVPGTRSVELALRTLRGSNIRRDCRAVLRKLVNKLGETCNLTVPDAGRVLYVERIETSQPLRMHLQPGSWVPMHCTASGKLFLASLSLLERKGILAQLSLTRLSARTIVDREALDKELERIAKRGIGVDNEEFVRGMIAVAVPVRDTQGRVVAAIACHAPTARLSLDDMQAGVPHLHEAAKAIQAVLFPEPS